MIDVPEVFLERPPEAAVMKVSYQDFVDILIVFCRSIFLGVVSDQSESFAGVNILFIEYALPHGVVAASFYSVCFMRMNSWTMASRWLLNVAYYSPPSFLIYLIY
jgi:hypothetical protein